MEAQHALRDLHAQREGGRNFPARPYSCVCVPMQDAGGTFLELSTFRRRGENDISPVENRIPAATARAPAPNTVLCQAATISTTCYGALAPAKPAGLGTNTTSGLCPPCAVASYPLLSLPGCPAFY